MQTAFCNLLISRKWRMILLHWQTDVISVGTTFNCLIEFAVNSIVDNFLLDLFWTCEFSNSVFVHKSCFFPFFYREGNVYSTCLTGFIEFLSSLTRNQIT